MSPRLRLLIIGFVVLLTLALMLLDARTDVFSQIPFGTNILAGFISFLLTFVAVDWIVARRTHQEWSPVTLVALSDLRASVSEPGATPESARLLTPRLEANAGRAAIVSLVDAERVALGTVLGRWSSFLASQAGVPRATNDAAQVARALDALREAAAQQPVDGTSLAPPVRKAARQYDDALTAFLKRLQDASADLETHHAPPDDIAITGSISS